ncbi:NADP-dependent oxidoreductase [Micromonospora endolithica]|uniref:NADP-dependent oxidoreductase n=1 Tax=Micromonospora endolithica TaxID=230091 RepID=A0A3A9YVZ3_9ACTN|nr:NADP-dependent oxidoreductase [Micromonospora endolithica]RKN40213.1 NADP-dependent oxidoreductase [Micromonospora endolithica]TWJ22521.1 NADPH:quinone reductase-like Zn-dependent oxidoreductase [Micromonospora endolithica]
MKSIIVREPGDPRVLELVDTPLPEPGTGQLRIRVAAAAVNPIDLSARAGRLTAAGLMPPMPAYGLGWDVAGHVDATGPDAGRFRVGEPVIGLRDLLFAAGTHAEHVVLDESAVAPAPPSVPLVEAATLPLNVLTADRALDLAGLAPGRTLLVTGASGGVGGFLVELAALRGLRTVALARPRDAERIQARGAAEVVTSAEDLGATVRRIVPGGVDAVIDAAVLGITAHQALRGGGTFVALVAPFAPPPIRGTRVVVQEVLADGDRLAELARLADDGLLTTRVAQVFGLERARAAHELLEQGGVGGRVVLTP